jgi:hypothetical protein
VRGWKANGQQTTRTVYGPHPWSEMELGVDALYGLGMSGENGMNRTEAQSATNSTRFMGDLGALQPFNNIPAPSGGHVPVKQAGLPSAGGQGTSPNPVLDLIGNTLG